MTGTVVALAESEQLRTIWVKDVFPSKFNPRKSCDDTGLDELAASIREHGIQVPLLVRQRVSEKLGQHFEIVAGHRRHAAVNRLGLDSVPCIVREMTDDQAREIALIDNLQREDMPALEEADAYEVLRQQLGTAEAIALRVGKPIKYVAKRLALVKLGPNTRTALAERLITIDHALHLAGLGLEEENAALKWCLDRAAGSTVKVEKVLADQLARRKRDAERNWRGTLSYVWEPESPLALRRYIQQNSGRALAKAPWDLDDAQLVPAVGACSGCPQNTAHNTSLFGDLSIEKATCADGICFESKRAAFVHIQIAKAGGEKAVARLSWKYSAVRPKMSIGKVEAQEKSPILNVTGTADLSKVLRSGQWIKAKKGSCSTVISGVTVDWLDGYGVKARNPGETLLVCVTEKCKAHPKSYEKKADEGGSRGFDLRAQKEREEKNIAASVAENKLRLAFVAAALEGITKAPDAAIRELVSRGLPNYGKYLEACSTLLPGILKIVTTFAVDSPEFAKAMALASLDGNEFQVSTGGWPDDSENGRGELITAVRALGYTGQTPWEKPVAAAVKPVASKAVPAKKAAATKAVVKPVSKPGKKSAGKPIAKPAAKKAAKKPITKTAAKKAAKKAVKR